MNPLPPLKRASGVQPGAVHPTTWNQLADLLKELDRRIRSLQPQSSPDVKIRKNQSGFTAWTPRRRSNAIPPPPLTLIRGTSPVKVQIVPGYVNSIIPTLGGDPINSPVAPATTPLTPEITVAEDLWVWIKCVGTFGTPDSYVATIETSPSETVPSGTAITGTGFVSFYPIGNVVYDTSTDSITITNSHSGGNLGVDSWGLYNLWWRS